MFQSAWTDKNNIEFDKILNYPEDFIERSDIECVSTLYWDEHCLECSAPACYKTCQIYYARKDGACRRLQYGFKLMKSPDKLLWRIFLKFRKWGKIEARINKGTMSPADIEKYNRKEINKAKLFTLASYVFSPKKFCYSSKWDGLRRKKYAELPQMHNFCSDFLFQCRYDGQENFNMFFEITDKENTVIYKESITVCRGYNQKIIKLAFSLPEGGLVRLYPENNFEAELEIYAADFVRLKKAVPKDSAKKVKCVAWDLDNTVWKGILAETDPEELTLRDGVLDTIQELDKKGIIQIIVSKNDCETVIPVLKRLNIFEYFVYVFANWQPKSRNIYYAARALNIGLDTFALIDDSVYERSEVSDALPCVRVYDEIEPYRLLNLSEFDVPVTDESLKRRISYQQEAKRSEIKVFHGGNNANFIRSCNLKIRLEIPKTVLQKERSLELLQRTNQLNLSGHKYSAEEFEMLLQDNSVNKIIMYAKDKFGDYGQVAFICYKKSDNSVHITEYAMSCRVAGKLVENALFNWFRAKFDGHTVYLDGIKTDRNGTLTDALKTAGLSDESNNGKIKFALYGNSQIVDVDAVAVDDKT